jgi:hypothetical protein
MGLRPAKNSPEGKIPNTTGILEPAILEMRRY